jgi:NAD-dependent dihydropyrimidine dehydrogenase PreA subunit
MAGRMVRPAEAQAVPTEPQILFCHCAYAQVVPREVKEEVLRRLGEAGAAYEAVPDLCEMVARRDPLLQRLSRTSGLRIAACYPRAVRWLFAAAEAPLPADTVIRNMRVESAEDVVSALLDGSEREHVGPSPRPSPCEGEGVRAEPGRWKPWFPVIDYGRCTNCKQCLSFCLFGVYGIASDGRVRVQNERNCKTDCPACARVCPEVAIMFPKHNAGPINGDEVRPGEADRSALKVDVSSLLGGDVYMSLRSRGREVAGRFSPQRDEERSRQERQRRLREFNVSVNKQP